MSTDTDRKPWPEIGNVFEKITKHWVIRRHVTGYNGIGCPWINEHWYWPTGGICRTEILTLSLPQTVEMLETFKLLIPSNPQPD